LNSHLAILVLLAVLVAIALSGCTQSAEENVRAPAGAGYPHLGDFNRLHNGDMNRQWRGGGAPPSSDMNRQWRDFNADAGFAMAKKALGLPEDASDSDLKIALGLPQDATAEQVMNAVFQKIGRPGRDMNG
jgi:hypothetical protein